jgi:hypothetical protein
VVKLKKIYTAFIIADAKKEFNSAGKCGIHLHNGRIPLLLRKPGSRGT